MRLSCRERSGRVGSLALVLAVYVRPSGAVAVTKMDRRGGEVVVSGTTLTADLKL